MKREALHAELLKNTTPINASFFKTGPGDYAEHDQFMGVKVPVLRKLAKEFKNLELSEIKNLLASSFNEERLLALFILIEQYKKATPDVQDQLYQFYMQNIRHVNNWNLVDASAHLIIGSYLTDKDRSTLIDLAKSKIMWERRIAIVATWWFIRLGDFEWTLKLAEILLHDTHDLIHKAVGWMLREVGQRDVTPLLVFLDQHAQHMPRTMLRYAIEKFDRLLKEKYLK